MDHTSLGVIFDMDGVIVHSNPAHIRAIKTFCSNHGGEVSDEYMHNHLFGRTNEEWIPELLGHHLTDAEVEALANEKEQLFRDDFSPVEQQVPGVRAFLRNLHDAKIPLAVGTSAPKENAAFILSALGITNLFTAILNSSHVSNGKPHPEMYQKAAKALQLEPKQCIVFEDSISGVKAAHAAGATVIGVTTTHNANELPHCARLIKDFSNLTLADLRSLLPA